MQIPHVVSATELHGSGRVTPTSSNGLDFGSQQQSETTGAALAFHASDPGIRADILKMIVQVRSRSNDAVLEYLTLSNESAACSKMSQYLENERLFNAAAVLQDEVGPLTKDWHLASSVLSLLYVFAAVFFSFVAACRRT